MYRAAALPGLTVVDEHATELARDSRRRPRRSWRRCYAGTVVRRLTSLANLLVVLAVASGSPQWVALAAGVWLPTSPRAAISADALTPDAAPAEPRAARDGSRSQIATVWQSVRLHPALLPTNVLVPSSSLSTALARAVAPFRASAATASHAVRGPPVDLRSNVIKRISRDVCRHVVARMSRMTFREDLCPQTRSSFLR